MKIGIVGLGLIGGCLGLDLGRLGHTLYGVGRRRATCEQAVAMGAVTAAEPALSSLSKMDLVIVCTPMAVIEATVAALATMVSSTTVITDVGSVKSPFVKVSTEHWPRFVGGHPMAGKAEAGIAAAAPGLFRGRPYVVTPVAATDPTAVDCVVAIATQLQAHIHMTDPETHDRAVAAISHLPVMVSASLIQACLAETDPTVKQLAQQLASSGFRDTSRVGGGNPDLGRMMAQYNQPALLKSLTTYRHQLDHLITAIEINDWQTLAKILTETQQGRPNYVRHESQDDL